ncbi:MAG: cytochrome c maturation protein CcmE [Chloroflexota bacterium]
MTWLRLGVVGLVVAACVGYLVWSAAGSSAQYYQTIAEVQAHAAPGDVRVLGVVQDDLQKLDGGQAVRFTATDQGASMLVDYRGPLPDIFTPGIQVVVEGRAGSDGVFHARSLLAKCPSRFTAASPRA